MELSRKIFVAGHGGLVGSALVRQLKAQGYTNIVTRGRAELDLMCPHAVRTFFETQRPEYVFLSAGRTGGVYANDTYRADFLYENLILQSNVIHQAFLSETRKLIFFGCSCMYPKLCAQPMREDALLSGPLEPTNEPFAIAKLAGMKMCESYYRQYGCDFITIIPTNLYGLQQDYTPLNCLIIPALIARFHEAKAAHAPKVSVWGSGRPSRDFLFADDLADAAIFLMKNYSSAEPINVGSGADMTVREVAETIREVVGYQGDLEFDASKPDGVLMKLQDISKISGMGWKPRTDFRKGIALAYEDYLRAPQQWA
ncbi:MAG: GDP-L-fucose synthase [Deltaproteobacteria bacterium]|nr:GDP-L-fucose synthase [Deltaproteobacteria bacterium]